MSDSWAYKEIAGGIARELAKQEPKPRPQLTGSALLLAEALDHALEMVGRNGRDVLYGFMDARYGLQAVDIQTRPGVYMSALRDLLDTSASVVERFALNEIRERTGIEAHTVEEAVQKLTRTGLDQSRGFEWGDASR